MAVSTFRIGLAVLILYDDGKRIGTLVHTKTKKTMYNNFELFRVREELVPVEMMEMRDKVINWRKLAVING